MAGRLPVPHRRVSLPPPAIRELDDQAWTWRGGGARYFAAPFIATAARAGREPPHSATNRSWNAAAFWS